MKYWKAVCSSCGEVNIAQKSKPTSCKEKVRTGARSIRRCGNELSGLENITAQVEAAKACEAEKAAALLASAEPQPLWTKDVIAEFDRIVNGVSSRSQLTRIDSRLVLEKFIATHGKFKCDAMFAHLEAGGAKEDGPITLVEHCVRNQLPLVLA